MQILNKKTFIFVILLLALLPIMLLRDFTPDNELRYLSIADEALRNHTFFAFTNHGVAYADKPPFYLWLVMLLRWVLGSHQMWALSLLSLIPAGAIACIMDRWAEKDLNVQQRPIAFLLLLSTGLFLGAALTVRMDMLMCLFIILAMRSFWRMLTSSPQQLHKQQWLFAFYTFMALFTKGPFGVLFPLLTSIVFLLYLRQPRKLTWVLGWRTWAVLLAGCAIWWGLTYAEGGAAYLNNLLFHQTVDRAVNAFHHKRPFYYYFICLWYCLAPWAIYAIVSLVRSRFKDAKRSVLSDYYLLSGITIIVVLSCVSSKLQIYMLPALPLLIYAAAMNLKEDCDSTWCKVCLAIPAAIFALVLPAVIVYAHIITTTALPIPLIGYAAAAVLSIGGIYSLYVLCKRKSTHATYQSIRAIAYTLFATLFVGGFALIPFDSYVGYRSLCKRTLELSNQTGIKRITGYKLKNASDMDVYLGRSVDTWPLCETPVDSLNRPTLLLAPTNKLTDLNLPQKEVETVGKYSIVIIK